MRVLVAASVFGLSACASTGTGSESDQGIGPDPRTAPLRRLSSDEYRASVQDLFPGLALPPVELGPDPTILGLDSLAEGQTSSEIFLEALSRTADGIAQAVTEDPDTLTGCDAEAVGDVACARAYLEDLGRRAYRRPLEGAELEALEGLFASSEVDGDYHAHLAVAISAVLQSPYFVFRPELGVASSPGEPRRLSSHEIATRLSYLVTGSIPDKELREAADRDALADPRAVQEQAERLLGSSQARVHLIEFHRAFLGLQNVASLQKDPEAFPAFTPEVASAMAEESRRFFEELLFRGGSYRDLMSAPFTLGDSEERAGLLTQPALLATLAKKGETDPVRRGKFVLERILCQPIAAPGADVLRRFEPMDPGATMRERFAAHEADPVCAGCHALIDPIGLSFEHYDAAGAYRETDRGLPLDVRGEVLGQQFEGPIELGRLLGERIEARRCYATQWFRLAMGRLEVPGTADDELLDELSERLGPDAPLSTVLSLVVRSRAFRTLPEPDTGSDG